MNKLKALIVIIFLAGASAKAEECSGSGYISWDGWFTRGNVPEYTVAKVWGPDKHEPRPHFHFFKPPWLNGGQIYFQDPWTGGLAIVDGNDWSCSQVLYFAIDELKGAEFIATKYGWIRSSWNLLNLF